MMNYNIIPLRDTVVFPNIVTPLFISRPATIKAVEDAGKKNMQIVLATQKKPDIEKPTADDMYETGTLADIVQIMKLPDGTLKLLVEGIKRVHIDSYYANDVHSCEVTFLEDEHNTDISDNISKDEEIAFHNLIVEFFDDYLKKSPRQSGNLIQLVKGVDNLGFLTDIVVSHLQINIDKKISFLAESDVYKRAVQLTMLLEEGIDLLDLENTIRERVQAQMDKNHREYYLNEKAKAIQKELEEIDDSQTEFGKLESDITAAKMPVEVEKKCLSELEKLKKIPSQSPEAVVSRNYLDYMVAYPWSKSSKTNNDIQNAKDILESSHYGLEKVKERIIEYIAVQMRTQKVGGSILCLVGPPGVGKTSIGKSVAQAVNREYIRMALGGVRDESEIRGHRKTYIGSMPGKIVQNITKTGVNNPLFLLDEIDKMGMDHRGDPASAMLEVLDPEQNHSFNDHYMEVDTDLSNVMFIATANSLNMPEALLDRMEIIRLPGYTESEKVNIAKQYLIPRNLERTGLAKKELTITDTALKQIVENYTREAGVRQLDREIAKICRKAVTDIALEKYSKVSVSKKNVAHFLGVAKYQRENLNTDAGIGRINGLAWTSVGGELLNIEVVVLAGKGKVTLTGKLGDVMKESVEAAMTVVKAYCGELDIASEYFQQHDFHIHLPEAATPKDGPSAGTAMVIALLSAITKQPISNQIAMTGEVSLQGRVLAIGGLKEKLFAAVREGITTVFIPKGNEKDLAEIPAEITAALKIIPVSHITHIIFNVFGNSLNNSVKNIRKEFYIKKTAVKPEVFTQQH